MNPIPSARPSLKPITIQQFFKSESASGLLMMAAALLAMIAANTPLLSYYQLVLDTPVEVRIGALQIAKPLLLWINDGLMALFFFLVGLELKREVLEGELSERSNVILPGIGAIGGMIAPALIYVYFNIHDRQALAGWAIPAATDIAFALGVLALLGSRVPLSMKIFLTSLAIFDDIGAIIIIALFYTENISATALAMVAICLSALFLMNRRHVESKSAFILVGIVMWVAMLKSGVHATLAGVIVAQFIPLYSRQDPNYSPLKRIERDLHTPVAYFILPLFAFANAGISLHDLTLEQVLHPVTIGIGAGLFIGKQAGIFSLVWLSIQLGFARLPKGVSWLSLYGVSALCGIGFTMSLFIGSLAFGQSQTSYDERLGIILGSLVSACVGYFILKHSLPAAADSPAQPHKDQYKG